MSSRSLRPTFARGLGALTTLTLIGALGAFAPTAASAAAQTAPVKIPSTCRAAVTVVRPDTTLSLGVVLGETGRLYSTGKKLGYTPKTIAYLGTSSNRGITIDRFLAVHPNGDLRRVTVTERARTGGTPTVSLADATIGRGWGSIRNMVSSGPYLYGLTTTGGFKRYAISKDYTVKSAGTIATTGWGGVSSLAYGGWWKLPGNRQAEDIVALTSTGAVKAYVIPRDVPSAVQGHTLKSGGWGVFDHLAAGECSTGPSRMLVGVKPSGDVHAYLDVNADDQSGTDIKAGPRVARSWTGLVAD